MIIIITWDIHTYLHMYIHIHVHKLHILNLTYKYNSIHIKQSVGPWVDMFDGYLGVDIFRFKSEIFYIFMLHVGDFRQG